MKNSVVVQDPAAITIRKFYDANANGLWDPGEVELAGWKMGVTNTTTGYAPSDQYTVAELSVEPGEYIVWEYFPAEPSWHATTPTAVTFTLVDDDAVEVVFGNLCLGAGGGRTLGFWSNKNGQRRIDGDELYVLSQLNLRDLAGDDFDPVPLATYPPSSADEKAGKEALAVWLKSGNAWNMAYMLSVQLAAMELNVLNGFVDASSVIYAPGTPSTNAVGFAVLRDVMADANAALGAAPVTTASSPERDLQEVLKDALDNANNDLNFLSSSPCAMTF